MALVWTKNLYFRTQNSFMTPFLLSSYFHTHPLTLLLEILGERMHGHPPQIFLGAVPPVSLSLRPCVNPLSQCCILHISPISTTFLNSPYFCKIYKIFPYFRSI